MSKHILPAGTPISSREYFVFGFFGGGGFLFSYMMFTSLVMYYFTDVLGISGTAAGILLLLTRIWDGLNDPIMGNITDRTHSRWGKNRPYIIVGGVFLSIFTVLLFTAPKLESQAAKIAWAAFTYVGYDMSYTCCLGPMQSISSRMTTERHGFAKMASAFFCGSSAVSIVASLSLMPLIEFFSGPEGDLARGYHNMAIFAAAIVLAFSLICGLGIKERDIQGDYERHKVKTWDSIKAVFSNGSYLAFLVSWAVFLIGYMLSANSVMYYCTYNLGSADYYTPLIFADYAMPIIAALTMAKLVQRFDKKRISVVSMLVTAAAYLLRYLTGDGSVFVMVALSCVAGVAIGYVNAFIVPLALDCSIYSENRTGLQLQGTFTSVSSLLSKISSGIAGAMLGFIQDASGYVANAPEQTGSALSALKICTTLSVAIGAFIAVAIFAGFYRLRHEELERMNAENIARRGITETSGDEA